ncbi:hypothetical protein CCR75_004065 [Bremia lactucae]|uniref:Uncharacterized protein n=1 Tax=Bremia lactucae TaxID=4779 RepID=A0A976IJR1_BRELC|nr:hypothetical protein CCR75_004065 [Bremia lactucae]
MEPFFAGFNAEELAMMQELLRLLLEDDDVLNQQPTPGTNARQDGNGLLNELAGGIATNDNTDYQWRASVPNGVAWNAPPAMMFPTPQYATHASRARTSSHFGSEDEPMLKRGRVDVASTMRTPVNCNPFFQDAGFAFY